VPPEDSEPWAPWLALARDDLAMARTLLTAGSAPWGICYHAQQTVEKALKAVIVARGDDPPRTHNLVRLNDAVETTVLDGTDDETLAALTVWATEQRYPTGGPLPDRRDAERAVAFAERALAIVMQRIEQTGP
jgi:HEPN domain-containing protein